MGSDSDTVTCDGLDCSAGADGLGTADRPDPRGQACCLNAPVGLHRDQRWHRLGSSAVAIDRLTGLVDCLGNESCVISLEIPLSRPDLAAVRCLATQLPLRGLLDDPAAVVALWQALDDAVLQDRACMEAVHLLMCAGVDEQATLAPRLGPVAG